MKQFGRFTSVFNVFDAFEKKRTSFRIETYFPVWCLWLVFLEMVVYHLWIGVDVFLSPGRRHVPRFIILSLFGVIDPLSFDFLC